MTNEAPNWTIAYRRPKASTFRRVTNWRGTWQEASDMANRLHDVPEFDGMEVWYVPTRAAELSGYSHAEDIGNILTYAGKRVWMTETGTLPASVI